jgi:hypothetical protein
MAPRSRGTRRDETREMSENWTVLLLVGCAVIAAAVTVFWRR